MAQTFNFETRELCPYREDWNRGGRYIKISGALWYIKEEDSIFLLDTEETRTHPSELPYNRYCIAKGLPAALLAQGDALVRTDFDYMACYQAYFKEAEQLFPQKPAYDMLTILEDWEYTLQKAMIVERNLSGFVDNYSLMCVAVFIKARAFQYHINSLEERIYQNCYYTCHFQGKAETQFVFSEMPTIENRSDAPFIYSLDVGQPLDTAKPQADGFMAAIINLAIFYYWKKRWSEYNFTDLNMIKRMKRVYQEHRPIMEISDIRQLSFDFPDEVEDICKAYMTAFVPIMRKVWKMKPTVHPECIEEDNIYSYIYAHEESSPDKLYASELYANLTDNQKRTLVSYGKRFMEWLPKNYPITPSSQYRVMQAMGKDLPPIQLTINNDVQIIQHGAETKEEKHKKQFIKFAFIITDEMNEILKIHKRIEMCLSSPSKLREELRSLHNDKVLALPLQKPTEIARELQRVWGDKAPKVGSFKTTWGRVRC